MSRKQLNEEMDATEVYKWMAYFMSLDEEKNKKIMHEVHLEKSAEMTDEERSQALIDMFKSLGNR